MISGNTEGIKDSILDQLEQIYQYQLDKNYVLNLELIQEIIRITSIINREISVIIDRRGNILDIIIGDNREIEIPRFDSKRNKLSGISIIHTHPNGNPMLSSLDISALVQLKLDYISSIGVKEGIFNGITFGFCSVMDNKINHNIVGPLSLNEAENLNIKEKIESCENELEDVYISEEKGERAIIVGIDSEESLSELEELAEACNITTVQKVYQNKERMDSSFYVGKGKLQEIFYLRQNLNANLIIFDDELSAIQLKNIEDVLGVKIIDRTILILEIFARRARTKEAKIQVELAQLKYRLPRLTGMGLILSRTGGGIGTRGPGEKKLETDKRHIRNTIYDLKDELKKIRLTRQIQRQKRDRDGIPKVALVGYTNAGKSTLRNTLCNLYGENNSKEEVLEANMLFATLETTVRALVLEDGRKVTLTDTVGFINKLPHGLVEAFKSTLEEVIEADILLHVVDASSDNAIKQINVVNQVLKELKCYDKKRFLLLNKIDLAQKDIMDDIKSQFENENIIEISAKKEINLESVMEIISLNIPNSLYKAKFLIPYNKQNIVSLLHENSNILEEEYVEDGTLIYSEVEEKIYNKYKEFIIE